MKGSTDINYIEFRITVMRELTDPVCDYIIQNITNGLVLEDEDEVDYTVIIFYVPDEEAAVCREPLQSFLAHLDSAIDWAERVRERQIRNVEWVEEYRRSVRPVRIASDVLIRPPWTEPEEGVKYDIIIEPKMAFGTGTHETTQSCLDVIRRRLLPEARFLDLGAGSGILSILADKMGASYIKAVDYDPIATDNCLENFGLNQVSAPYDVVLGAIDVCDGDEPYDMVVANIIRDTILPWVSRMVKLAKPSGCLTLSGLLADDVTPISDELTRCGQTEFTVYSNDIWRTFDISVTST